MGSITVFKWWLAWDYERIENWLEEMEQKGFTLSKVTGIGVNFHFEASQSKKVRYCIDYQSKLKTSYLEFVRDNGWELIQMGAGWYVCRKEYTDERPELYTDYSSIINRNKKLFAILVVAFIPLMTSVPNLLKGMENNFTRQVVQVLWTLIFIVYFTAIIKLSSMNKAYKDKRKIVDK